MLTQFGELSQGDQRCLGGLTRSGIRDCSSVAISRVCLVVVPCTWCLSIRGQQRGKPVPVLPPPVLLIVSRHDHPSGRRSPDLPLPQCYHGMAVLHHEVDLNTVRPAPLRGIIHWGKTVVCPLFLDIFNGNARPSVQLRQHQSHQPHIPTT